MANLMYKIDYLPLKHEYRILHVDHYSLFYVVEHKRIEIYRVIHARRDALQILKRTDG